MANISRFSLEKYNLADEKKVNIICYTEHRRRYRHRSERHSGRSSEVGKRKFAKSVDLLNNHHQVALDSALSRKKDRDRRTRNGLFFGLRTFFSAKLKGFFVVRVFLRLAHP